MTLMWPISITVSNLVQIGQELAEICLFVYFPRWRPPLSWIIKKWHFRPLITLVLPVSISTPNLVQIDQELAEIHFFVYFPRWRRPPSWIFKKWHYRPLMTLLLPVSPSTCVSLTSTRAGSGIVSPHYGELTFGSECIRVRQWTF